MRRLLLLVAVVASLVVPASAIAAPGNDEAAGAQTLAPNWTSDPGANPPLVIQALPGQNGWEDATPNTNVTGGDSQPSCSTVPGYYSMWYTVKVNEASVMTVTLATQSGVAQQYQPIVTVYPSSSAGIGGEIACGLGGSAIGASSTATASSYVAAGTYYVRIASAILYTDPSATTTGGITAGPALQLSALLRDVTPPQIQVQIPSKILGTDKTQVWTFNATGSTDNGSGKAATAVWDFYSAGQYVQTAGSPGNPLIGKHRWTTAGLHRVTLTLSDMTGNQSTYTFYVYVHNFTPPKVGLRVFVPLPGAKTMRVRLTHSAPVYVRLVIFQGAHLLRSLPRKLVKGQHTTTSLTIPLLRKVSKTGGYITITGTASAQGLNPATVPLLTCSVDPVSGSGHCA